MAIKHVFLGVIALFLVSGCDALVDDFSFQAGKKAESIVTIKFVSICLFELRQSDNKVSYFNLSNVSSLKTKTTQPVGRHILYIDDIAVAKIKDKQFQELADSFKSCSFMR